MRGVLDTSDSKREPQSTKVTYTCKDDKQSR